MIPIQNIYYLLSYAWNQLEENEPLFVDVKKIKESENLLARIFINGILFLLNNNWQKNYIEQTNIYQGIKGKFELSSTLKKNILHQYKTICTADEWHSNILAHQIFKTTLQNIIRIKNIDNKIKKESISILRKLKNIDEIIIDNSLFSKAVSYQKDKTYILLLNVCQMIFNCLLPSEQKGKYLFKKFVKDKRQMAHLFENFIKNFYEKELPNKYKVQGRNIEWKIISKQSSTHLLPLMKTDTVIEHKKKKLIIDTKFYKKILTKNFNNKTFHSQHLFQMYSYLKNLDKNSTINGLLLYPTVVQNFKKEKITFEEHVIFFRTINLNQNWKKIHRDLMNIHKKCFPK